MNRFVFLALLTFSCMRGPGVGPDGKTERKICSNIKGLLVPAYAHPTDLEYWQALTAVPSSSPMIVIFNVEDGPGTSYDSNWHKLINEVRKAGHTAVGYVFTRWGRRATDDVIADINLWFELYPGIEGIFLDEVSDNFDYYRALYEYIKGRGQNFKVILNPGIELPTDFDIISDIVVFWEYARSPEMKIPQNVFDEGAVIIHSFVGNLTETVRMLDELSVHWIYITDDIPPNPYDKLPSFFSSLTRCVSLGEL